MEVSNSTKTPDEESKEFVCANLLLAIQWICFMEAIATCSSRAKIPVQNTYRTVLAMSPYSPRKTGAGLFVHQGDILLLSESPRCRDDWTSIDAVKGKEDSATDSHGFSQINAKPDFSKHKRTIFTNHPRAP